MKMTQKFLIKIINSYTDDKIEKNILKMLKKKITALSERNTNAEHLIKSVIFFCLDSNLIYYKNMSEKLRLCLLMSFEKEIFALTHNKISSIRFYRSYQRIVKLIYFYNISC